MKFLEVVKIKCTTSSWAKQCSHILFVVDSQNDHVYYHYIILMNLKKPFYFKSYTITKKIVVNLSLFYFFCFLLLPVVGDSGYDKYGEVIIL